MAQHEASEESTMPGMPPRIRRRDMIGDEDVTSQSDREILLRVANDGLARDFQIGQLAAGQARIETRCAAIETRLARGGEIEQRVRQESVPAFEEVAGALRDRLVAEIHSSRGGVGNITKEQVEELLSQTLTSRELARYKAKDEKSDKLRDAIIVSLVGALIAALIGLGVQWVTARNAKGGTVPIMVHP